MKFSTMLGAAIGSAIDGRDGDDSTLDGAIGGAVAATAIRTLVPVAITFATGWLVLRGIGKLKDKAFGGAAPAE
jgi:hypothetical protein